jgi:hypothetical protein
MRLEIYIGRITVMNKRFISIKKPCKHKRKCLITRAKYDDGNRGDIETEQYYLVYFNLGLALTKTRKYGDALHFFLQASHYFEKFDRGTNRTSAQILVNVARIYKILHKGTEASIYLTKIQVK